MLYNDIIISNTIININIIIIIIMTLIFNTIKNYNNILIS